MKKISLIIFIVILNVACNNTSKLKVKDVRDDKIIEARIFYKNGNLKSIKKWKRDKLIYNKFYNEDGEEIYVEKTTE